jgi:hypothetical protein
MIKLFVTLIAIFSIGVAGLSVLSYQNAHYNCVQLEHVKAGTLKQIARSDKTLPTLTYYKMHPKQLQAALEVNARLEEVYAPQSCHGLFG